MLSLRHWPIRQKLNLAIIGTSTLAIIIASAVLFSYVWFNMKKDILENLSAMGEAIASNSTAAISFQDAQSATETLSALDAKPEIMLACLYISGQDEVFARYAATQSNQCPQKAPGDDAEYSDELIHMSMPVILDKERLGSLYIERNLTDLKATTELYTKVAILVMLVCVLISILLSTLLQRLITDPILALLDTANRVSSDKDYSLRANKRGDDEVGRLIDGFNAMLAEIEKRDSELDHAHSELEQQVQASEAANAELQDTLGRLQKTQEQLVNTEKMASLGGLVAGIAHEINTPVGVGVTAASTLLANTDDMASNYEAGTLTNSGLKKYVGSAKQSTEIILTNLNRAAELIQSFKQVAVDQSSSELRQFQLTEYINEILLSLRPKLKKTDINVVVDCDPNIVIKSYPGAFSQILTNLVMNTLAHAYPDGGKGEMRIEAQCSDGRLHLDFSDDGCGIPKDHQSKIFDPFFTTKRGQGGSGLGMHIVYNLVSQQLGGRLSLSSEPGVGTRFTIDIPVEQIKQAQGEPA